MDNVQRAKDALARSKTSLYQVHEVPSWERSDGEYCRLLVSLVMLDGAQFIGNIRALGSDAMLITEACATPQIADHSDFINKVARAVIEFNKTAQTLALRFSNALSRTKALKDRIGEEMDRRHGESDKKGVDMSTNTGEPRGLFMRTIDKLRSWLSIMIRYARRHGKREFVASKHSMADESGDLLMLALALHDLDILFQCMKDLVVSIGDFMRTANNETEMFIGWFVADPRKIESVVESIENLETDLVHFTAIFRMFGDIAVARSSGEDFAECEPWTASSATGVESG